jgi:hypothetical protein
MGGSIEIPAIYRWLAALKTKIECKLSLFTG